MASADRTLILIPARGGSKRLPRKNVLPLGGKPLILHSVDVALAAAPKATVMVSTNDAEIKAVATSRPDVVIDDRAEDLSGDTVKVIDVARALVERPEVRSAYDVIGVLLPTCPFRTADQVRSGLEALSKDVDAVISFTTYEFAPLMAVTFDQDGIMVPLYNPSPLVTGNTRTQDQVAAYRPNGAFFFLWIEAFRQLHSFYSGRVKGILMPRINSVDIDDAFDFDYAQFLIDRGEVKIP